MPKLFGIMQIYENSDLRARHKIPINFSPASSMYRKLLILEGLAKFSSYQLFTQKEVSHPVVSTLLVIKFGLIFVQDGSPCPAQIKNFINQSQIHQIARFEMNEIY